MNADVEGSLDFMQQQVIEATELFLTSTAYNTLSVKCKLTRVAYRARLISWTSL